MVVALLAVLALQEAEVQDLPAPEPAAAAAPASEPARRIPADAPAAAEPRRLRELPESGPSLGGFVFASVVVVVLLGGAYWALRRFGGSSRLLGTGGPIQLLGRRSLGVRQEVLVVAVGRRALVLGSTSSGLSTLAEITNPDELAALRAEAPERRADSERRAFGESLRREMAGEPAPVFAKAGEAKSDERAFETIAQELAEIRKTVHAWKA